METVIRACVVFGTWVFVHYITPRLYLYWCVPATIVGFLMSPFVAAMPHCIALRWTFVTSADAIKTMFVLLGTWIVSHLVVNNVYTHAVPT